MVVLSARGKKEYGLAPARSTLRRYLNSIETSPSWTFRPLTPLSWAAVGFSLPLAAIFWRPASSIWSKSISMSVTVEPADQGLLVLTSLPLTSTAVDTFRPPSMPFIMAMACLVSSGLGAVLGLEGSADLSLGMTTVSTELPPCLAMRKVSGSSLLEEEESASAGLGVVSTLTVLMSLKE